MRNESGLQHKITKYLRQRGALVYKFSSPGRRGVPDLLVLRDGAALFIEVKHPNGRGVTSDLQEHQRDQLRKQGFDVHVVDNFDAVKALNL